MKTITLEKDYSIKLSSSVVDFIYPDHVFIPISDDDSLKVGNKSVVKKEQLLLSRKEHDIAFSPISGVVVGAKDCILPSGDIRKCLVIENDFKEKMSDRTTLRKNFNSLTKKDFLDIVKNKLLNYEDLFNKKFDNIIINGIEDEPYIATKIFLLKNYSSEILEMLSLLSNIFNTKTNLIVLKNNDRENIEIYSNVLGTYPEIELNLLPDLYPLESKDLFLKSIGHLEQNTLVLSPQDIISCYYVTKKNKLLTEKYITITGNAIVNPIVVNAKIGSSVKKIIEEHIKFFNNDEVVYNINGLMRGKNMKIDDLIVTEQLNGIIINFLEELTESKCISCGKCYSVCPVGLDPNLIYNHKKNAELDSVCINCGLCTYICPSYINFKNKMEELRNEK